MKKHGKNLINMSIYAGLLLIEIFVYWRLRYLALRKVWVWPHLIGWVTPIVIMPLLVIAISALTDGWSDAWLAILQFISVGALSLGHLCFAVVLVEAWKNKKAT